jgi:hypothetical protein
MPRLIHLWASRFFLWLLSKLKSTHNTLLILTFDESGHFGNNRFFTTFSVGVVKSRVNLLVQDSLVNHSKVLCTIEDNFGLGSLGKSDSSEAAIEGIWK